MFVLPSYIYSISVRRDTNRNLNDPWLHDRFAGGAGGAAGIVGQFETLFMQQTWLTQCAIRDLSRGVYLT